MRSNTLYVVLLVLQVRNLHFNRTALHISTRLQSAYRILDRKTMRHQFPDVAQQPSFHESYRFWPRISIPVLEPEVHFPRRQPHERELHLVLPDANDKHGAAEPHGVNRSADRRLGACALKRDVRLCAAHRLDNPRRQRFRRFAECHAKCAHAAGCKRLGELEPLLVEVCDNERVGPRRARAEQRREPDRTRTTNER